MDTVGVKEFFPAGSSSPQAESDENLKYKMDYPEKGLCVIINMKEFSNEERKGSKKLVQGLDRREGSECDVESVQDVFEIIGFTVKVLRNKTCPELLESLKEVAEEDHSKRSCFVCVIMSHGEEGKFFWF
ncbi:caspase-3-like isoform X2 [Eleutherodactylus coqui]|uniref:caspase-3-like isoform X2 n=1 Tax=Eleutherodactylus coqui TaxID=57060 RepID=UPI0034637777